MATRHRIDDANASHRDAANRASGNSTGALSSRVPAGTVFTPPRMSARRDAITRPHDAASPLQDATRISHTVAGRATDATAYPPVSPAWPLLASSRFSDRRNAIIPPHDDAVPLHDAGRFRNIASGASSAAAPAYSLYPLYPSALRVARLTRHASPTHNARQTHDAAPTREAGPTRNTDPIKHASLTCDTAAGVSISTAIAALSLTAPPTCPLFPSSRVSALRDAAARLRDAGEVLGVPTDTVYALAASCRHPRSVERLYRVKERPARKPVCLCLSDIELLRDLGAPFSPLLWRFMRNCYPGGITCVVPKGVWLRRLGVGEAQQLIGTPSSVAIRVPDHAPLALLMDMAGPIALTSANPSGEPDSTHHEVVLQRLGHKIDGLVCDGPSNENVASTVVDCTKIDQGEISFVRVGCVPKRVVLEILEKTKASVEPDRPF